MYREFLEQVLPHLEAIGVPESHVLVIGDKKGRSIPANSITQHIRTVDQEFVTEPNKYSKQELENAVYKYTEEEIINSPSYLLFTSGSTGKRKAVMNTQHSVVSVLVNRPVAPGSGIVKILGCNRFFHCTSLILALHLAIYNGDEVYTLKNYSLEDLCIAIQRHKINSMMAIFYIISEMCKPSVADNYDLSSLTVVYNIGTRLHPSAIQRLMDRHGMKVIDVYGLTETLMMFHTTIEYTKKGSSGRLLYGYEARLVDEDGHDVPKGEEGQLCIKGPTIFKGYFKDAETTATAFDSNGFMITGDLMRCDDEGLFYYVDRFKDMMRYYEISIFPTTIESVIMKHPKVLECAVVGIRLPPTMIEVPRGYVRLYEQDAAEMKDEQATKNEIIEFAAALLPDEMRLRGGLYFIDSFPRTYSGKVRRYTLRVQANKEIMADYKAGRPIPKLSV
jgi:acyl-coenzyme A synthetase/AMP-(fatty) acid ligase